MATERFVVVGGLAAGMSAASRAKRRKQEMEVIVLEKSSFVSYGSCGLPYFISNLVNEVQGLVVHDAAFFREKRGIEVLTRHEVAGIDPETRVVLIRNLEQGEEIELNYTKLAICTGASPSRPELPGIDLKNNEAFIDRSRSGKVDFSEHFPGKHTAPFIIPQNGLISLRALVDKSSIELFINDGRLVMTELFFPDESYRHLSIYSSGGSIELTAGSISGLKSCW